MQPGIQTIAIEIKDMTPSQVANTHARLTTRGLPRRSLPRLLLVGVARMHAEDTLVLAASARVVP